MITTHTHTPLVLSPRDAGRILNGTPERTLERWRATGRGPKFVKLGRRVAYRLVDLEAFVAAGVRSHTGQQPTNSDARHKRAGA